MPLLIRIVCTLYTVCTLEFNLILCLCRIALNTDLHPNDSQTSGDFVSCSRIPTKVSILGAFLDLAEDILTWFSIVKGCLFRSKERALQSQMYEVACIICNIFAQFSFLGVVTHIQQCYLLSGKCMVRGHMHDVWSV